MNKYAMFCNFFDEVTATMDLPAEVQEVYNELRNKEVKEKPLFTEAGLSILEFLQQNDRDSWKAKDIADGMGISSRKVSGALRKVCTDGFVIKKGENPAIYALSDKGKEFNIEEYKINKGE